MKSSRYQPCRPLNSVESMDVYVGFSGKSAKPVHDLSRRFNNKEKLLNYNEISLSEKRTNKDPFLHLTQVDKDASGAKNTRLSFQVAERGVLFKDFNYIRWDSTRKMLLDSLALLLPSAANRKLDFLDFCYDDKFIIADETLMPRDVFKNNEYMTIPDSPAFFLQLHMKADPSICGLAKEQYICFIRASANFSKHMENHRGFRLTTNITVFWGETETRFGTLYNSDGAASLGPLLDAMHDRQKDLFHAIMADEALYMVGATHKEAAA